MLYHVKIQLVKHVIFFQHGNKITGTDDPPQRVDPACESFQRCGIAALNALDGLIIHFDPLVVQSIIKGFQNVALVPVGFIRFMRKINLCYVQIVADLLQRVFGVIQRVLEIHVGFHDAEPCLYTGCIALSSGFDPVVQFFNGFFFSVRIGMGLYDNEMIIGTTGDAVTRINCLKHIGDQLQKFIAFGISVLQVVGTQSDHIKVKQYRQVSGFPDLFDLLFNKFQQIIEVGQSGEGVRVKTVFLQYFIIFSQLPAGAASVGNIDVCDQSQI